MFYITIKFKYQIFNQKKQRKLPFGNFTTITFSKWSGSRKLCRTSLKGARWRAPQRMKVPCSKSEDYKHRKRNAKYLENLERSLNEEMEDEHFLYWISICSIGNTMLYPFQILLRWDFVLLVCNSEKNV